jgi:hypothetical protein
MIQQGLKCVGDFIVIQLCKNKAVHLLVNSYIINSPGKYMIALHKQFGNKEEFGKPAVVNQQIISNTF